MKVYEFGEADKPIIMLFPGTCCYWKSNFGHVIHVFYAKKMWEGNHEG